MTIQPIANQAVAPLNLLEVLNSGPHVFENICTNFDPQTMKNFLSTCKRVRQINNELKKEYPKTYSKLLDRIFPYAFCRKSIEQLSDEMVELCTNIDKIRLKIIEKGIARYGVSFAQYKNLPAGNLEQVLEQVKELSCELSECQKLQFAKLKDLLNALIISGKFNKIDKCKLESTFLFACEYGLTGLVELFINSDRYQDISIDRLNKAFKVWSLKDGGKTIQTLISSDRFREITPESLGNALVRASEFVCPDVVRAIMESGRGHEISLKDFRWALNEAAITKFEKRWKTLKDFRWALNETAITKFEKRWKTLRMLSNFPQFSEVRQKCPETYSRLLDRIFPHAFYREQLSDEMVELCTKIRKLYRLNSFKGGIDQYQLAELKDLLSALIITGKFDKIDKCKLESTFLFACEHGLTDIVEFFINSRIS